ncbi:MAG: hypothetical protein IJB85_04935, partial [Clostridia bacterium]|nr:hypothetical protein [Clostridia bacterium]
MNMKVKKAFMVVLSLLLIVYSGCLAQENTDETPWKTRVQDHPSSEHEGVPVDLHRRGGGAD